MTDNVAYEPPRVEELGRLEDLTAAGSGGIKENNAVPNNFSYSQAL